MERAAMTRAATPEDDHFFRVEVTVAAAIAKPDGRIFGNNMVDVTFGFSASMARPPEGASDALINAVISHHISAVAAAVQVSVASLGYALLGTIADPMNEHSTPTGEFGESSPVRVVIGMPGQVGRA